MLIYKSGLSFNIAPKYNSIQYYIQFFLFLAHFLFFYGGTKDEHRQGVARAMSDWRQSGTW